MRRRSKLVLQKIKDKRKVKNEPENAVEEMVLRREPYPSRSSASGQRSASNNFTSSMLSLKDIEAIVQK